VKTVVKRINPCERLITDHEKKDLLIAWHLTVLKEDSRYSIYKIERMAKGMLIGVEFRVCRFGSKLTSPFLLLKGSIHGERGPLPLQWISA